MVGAPIPQSPDFFNGVVSLVPQHGLHEFLIGDGGGLRRSVL
jgi:hypothetical protein